VAAALHHVREVHADRLDVQQHLTGAGLRFVALYLPEYTVVAELGDFDC